MMALRTLAAVCLLVLAGCLGGPGVQNALDDASEPETTTPAAGTPTETRSVPVTSFDSREALVEAAPFAVPDPDVPASFAFDSAIVSTVGNETRVSLAYHHVVGSGDDAQLRNVLTVEKFAGEALDLDQGEAVTVDGREMRYVEADGRRKLLWRCEDYTYRVSVQQFDEDFDRKDLRAVASSIECPESTTDGS